MLTALTTTLVWLSIGTPAPDAQAAPVRGVQLQGLSSDVSNAEIDQRLDLAKGANANVVRLDVAWSSLESEGKGKFSAWYVAKLDRLFTSAQARGIKVIATMWTTPCWASSAPESLRQGCAGSWWERNITRYAPTDGADLGDAIGWLTARYGPGLAAVEVWNEPNQGDRFLVSDDNAATYAGMLKRAYPRAKSTGNASVPIVAGAMAKADSGFLHALYANGIKDFEDGISVHPYNEWRSPDDTTWHDTINTMRPGLDAIRAEMRAAGDAKGIWVTEFGWTTASGTNWHVDAAAQAAYLARAMTILGSMSDVRAAIAYELQDSPDTSEFEAHFGLVDARGVPKPAYGALAAALATAPIAGAATDPAPATGAPVSVALSSDAGTLVVSGTAPPKTAVRLVISKCAVGAKSSSRATKRGRFARRVGSVSKLVGCTVTASVKAKSASTKARRPASVRVRLPLPRR